MQKAKKRNKVVAAAAAVTALSAACLAPHAAAQQAETATANNASVPPQASAAAGGFNPAISLILNGRYARYSNPSEEPGATGFMQPSHGHGEGDEHHGSIGKRGFSLANTELVVSSPLGSHFFGNLNLAWTAEEEVEVEEAYVQTTSLGNGLTAKGGRFLSGVGYISEQHAHVWDFVDQPLVYQTFFGEHLQQDGAQLRWIAPTNQFIELGAEASKRRSKGSGPAVFANVGGDVGTDHSWRVGVSHLRSIAEDRDFHSEVEIGGVEEEVHNMFSGDSRISGVNAVWKWAPDGNATRQNFKLQGEYFQRRENGEVTYDEEGADIADAYRGVQQGWYLQGVYQFMPRWRVGLRHDRLQTRSVSWGANEANLGDYSGSFKPSRNTVMVDFSPSELSRLRVQFARDRSQEGRTDNQFAIQYIMSFGQHGAHRF